MRDVIDRFGGVRIRQGRERSIRKMVMSKNEAQLVWLNLPGANIHTTSSPSLPPTLPSSFPNYSDISHSLRQMIRVRDGEAGGWLGRYAGLI